MAIGLEEAYQCIQEWVAHEPDLTLAQVKRSLATEYGLLVAKVGTKFKRTETVYREAKREAQAGRALRQAWMRLSISIVKSE